MAITSAIAAVAGTAYSVYAGERGAAANKKAATRQIADSKKAAQEAQRQYNKDNPNQPNIAALMKRNAADNGGGIGSTFLTGPAGVAGGVGTSTRLGQ